MSEVAARQTSSAVLATVWIVDDSPLEAELVRRALAPLYCVEVFTDGASVIEQFASQSPPDAVILDWRMPGISGIDVCHFLRGRPQTQSLPILMLTVQNGTHDLVQCLTAGADDFLAKPCNVAELTARVSALVRTKRMHERVLAAERAVRSLLMQLPEGVMSVNAAGEITFVNLEAQRMLGRAAEALIGKKLQQVLPGVHGDKLLPAMEDPVPLADITLDGRVYAPAVRRYAGVDATETTLSLRDVTPERRQAQERSRMLAAEQRARVQAEEASRAKDDFLAVVSHELRTPLNSILGWTRLLRGGYLDADKRARALDTIERSAGAQQKLIEDILDVSRIISGKMALELSTVNLGSAVKSSIDAVRLAAEAKAIDLKLEGADPAPRVVGDPNRLQQIVSNLLSNAVKFTPQGGAVTVTVDIDGAAARIRVRDTGKGISPDLLPHVFERFRQGDTGTSRSHGGLGLGLSIVRHLVDKHDGSVEVESAGPGAGSTFTVRIPLAADEPLRRASVPAVSMPSPVSGPASLQGVKVLVVDDDPDARDLMVAIFQQVSAQPRAVCSSADALQEIPTFRPNVIVSDVGMPGEDGYDLVARVRTLAPEQGGRTPTIALTAFAAPNDASRAIRAGFDAYLAKPVDSEDLIQLVAKLAPRG